MPKLITLDDLFLDLTRDVYYAEKKILKALPKMAKALDDDSELAAAFMKHEEETEGQVERLEKIFKMLDEAPRGKKCEAIEGLTAEADELIKHVGALPTLEAGLLAGAQAVEHYEIARYGTLIAWADLLGHDDAVGLLEQTLEQEKNTDELLTQLAESRVNEAACEERNNSRQSGKRAA